MQIYIYIYIYSHQREPGRHNDQANQSTQTRLSRVNPHMTKNNSILINVRS